MLPSSTEPKSIFLDAANARPISTLAGIEESNTYWPSSLAHLGLPYDNVGSDYVMIGDISEAPVAGFVGYTKVSVALVPHAVVERVLLSTAATGYEVQSHGPLPIIGDDDAPHRNGFWIEGFESSVRFEPLIHSWRGSNTEVVIPDSSLLMVFGLVPRQTGESEMSWDDPHGPVYDVVRTSTISDHQRPRNLRQRAYVEMRRDYLLEYCHIKQCAAVAFYYEHRWSDNDVVFDRVIGTDDNVDFNLPGRLLNLQIHRHDSSDRGHQYAQVWGRRLVIPRGERRVIEVGKPDLVWPDHPGSMSLERASHEHLFAWVRDEVLQQYESRHEFEIHPLSGGVSYGGQWSVSYCHRVGREHIAIEIKKLYEGSPNAVIEHWHRFAVPRSVADVDETTHGDRNIGVRAQELVRAYLAMTSALAEVFDRLGLSFDQVEIGEYSSKDVSYSGWWAIEELSLLANTVPMAITLDGFLERTIQVVKFLESLKEAPLRNAILQIGIDKQRVEGLRTMKLLATLCQLSKACKDAGYQWPDDAANIVPMWDKELQISSLRRLFTVNQLRLKAAHRTGAGFAASLANDLKVFGIVPAAQAAGWGRAVDSVYDGLIEDFTAIATLLTPSK